MKVMKFRIVKNQLREVCDQNMFIVKCGVLEKLQFNWEQTYKMQLQTFGKLNMCMKKQHLKDQEEVIYWQERSDTDQSLLRGINTVWIQGMMI